MEQAHLEAARRWIASGAELFRRIPPAAPPMHLVCYGVVLDLDARRVLLVDHRKARRLLPPGGHVDPGEDPSTTVLRELREELQLEARLLQDAPVFLTVTETVGLTAGHTDVTLWYAIDGRGFEPTTWDIEEFADVRWVPFDAIPTLDVEPHLSRFLAKR